jgi:hypothetical protein
MFIMSSTILQVRSTSPLSSTLALGSAARLFDVKGRVMAKKKLDQDPWISTLSVRNAATNEEYTDESILLPRGARSRTAFTSGQGAASHACGAESTGGGHQVACGQSGVQPPDRVAQWILHY